MVDRNEVSMSRVPILVILGATGSGKSRLAIELARRFSGEIISADSMQVYKGLDIVTAKVTPVERKAAPHHMLDIVDPLTNFSVIDFRNMALPIIDNLLARRKLPIVVGGTNYYIESVLWEILITDSDPKEPSMQVNSSATNSSTSIENRSDDRYNVQDRLNDSDDDDDETAPKKLKFDARVYDGSNEELHQRLMKIDPEMAFKLHPNNRRKVIRSLEIFYQHGKTHSELLKAQRVAGGCGLGGPLRYPNIIILWLRCNKKILDNRLNDRVDGMMEVGLVQELLDFHRSYNEQRIKSNTSADYTKGIFQSIGFKEFHTYLILSEKERASEKGKKLLQQGIDDLKLVTRRYAKRQDKWVMNRLIRRSDRQVPPVYSLDCTDVTKWDSRVLEPAAAIISAILHNAKPEQQPLNENFENQKTTDSSTNIYNYCKVCERVFVEEHQWQAHLKGGKHMKALKKKKKTAEDTHPSNVN
ncbi:tRNA dimethylallyltransferase, mitochondrial [Trachymyrmex septentrionalis]|uniref:tRNA dimethylallyltransferase, mitochondrial n=1 Tax=Trachymyrmex septentrionalis TaxID=34720 RepID=A0A195EZX8_9HYME|nr:PREDICTED: tRNA dimethylallyltransferase, mitochondrial [Trachymyrmex septentrionalis]KYN33429.1 tRNA dimethylallyltransferase, mitochondrial [Trachymyrmex septentrionalis]